MKPKADRSRDKQYKLWDDGSLDLNELASLYWDKVLKWYRKYFT